MEHSVATLEAKANVCCVKFNPATKYHIAFGSAGRRGCICCPFFFFFFLPLMYKMRLQAHCYFHKNCLGLYRCYRTWDLAFRRWKILALWECGRLEKSINDSFFMKHLDFLFRPLCSLLRPTEPEEVISCIERTSKSCFLCQIPRLQPNRVSVSDIPTSFGVLGFQIDF